MEHNEPTDDERVLADAETLKLVDERLGGDVRVPRRSFATGGYVGRSPSPQEVLERVDALADAIYKGLHSFDEAYNTLETKDHREQAQSLARDLVRGGWISFPPSQQTLRSSHDNRVRLSPEMIAKISGAVRGIADSSKREGNS